MSILFLRLTTAKRSTIPASRLVRSQTQKAAHRRCRNLSRLMAAAPGPAPIRFTCATTTPNGACRMPTTSDCSRSSCLKDSSRAFPGSRSCANARTSAGRFMVSIPSELLAMARDIARLMNDEGIVRNRLKIEATIDNARAYLALSEKAELAAFLWDFLDGRPIVNQMKSMKDVPPQTELSVKISKALKKEGLPLRRPNHDLCLPAVEWLCQRPPRELSTSRSVREAAAWIQTSKRGQTPCRIAQAQNRLLMHGD